MGAVGYTGGDPNKVDVAGDTMTGPLVLPGDPASGLQAATKDYVDTHGGGGGGGGTPSGTVVSETSYGQSAIAGAATAYSRGDHSHGTPALPTPAGIGAATSGHTHTGTYDPAGSASTALASALAADVPLGSSTPSAVAIAGSGAAGSSGSSSHQDHTHAGPGFGNVVAETSFGQSSGNGVASTVARSDHTHGTPTAPTVPSASSSVAAETSFGISSSAGVATTYSRGDHTHGTPASPTIPSAGATVVSETSFGQSSAAGAAATFSRSDHTHGTPAAPTIPSPATTVVAETTFGAVTGVGVSTLYARADHTHGTPPNPGGGGTAQLDEKAAIFGLKLAVMGPYEMLGAGLGLSAGTLIMCRVWVPSAMTLTKLGVWMQTAGITSSGVNGMAIYDAAGNLLNQTGDMSTQMASANQYVEGTLAASVNLSANTSVYLAIMAHFSGGNPTISGKAITGANFVAINGFRPSVYLTGQTSFPSSVTYGTANVNDASYCLYAQ
jgi:hypothetical protein